MSAKNTNPSALCGIRLSKIHCVRCVFESTHLSGSSFGDADSFDLYRDGNDRKRRLVGNFAEEKDLFIPSCVVAEERAEFLKYQVHRFVDTDFVFDKLVVVDEAGRESLPHNGTFFSVDK